MVCAIIVTAYSGVYTSKYQINYSNTSSPCLIVYDGYKFKTKQNHSELASEISPAVAVCIENAARSRANQIALFRSVYARRRLYETIHCTRE